MPDEARTYAPTPRKLRRARERGDVAKSPLLSAAVVLVSVAGVVALGARAAVAAWSETVARLWSSGATPEAAIAELGALWASVLAAPLGAAVVAATVIGLVQVGPLLAPGALEPDLQRLSPGAGLARLFRPATWASRLAPLPLGLMLAGVGLGVLHMALAGLLGRTELSALGALEAGASVLAALAWRACAVMLLAGAVAYGFARYRHADRLRMSRRERLDEQRRTEGDPQTRRARARRRRQAALRPSPREAAASAALLVHGAAVTVTVVWDGGDSSPTVGLVARGPARAALRRHARATPEVRDVSLAARLHRLDTGAAIPRAEWPSVAAALLRAPR